MKTAIRSATVLTVLAFAISTVYAADSKFDPKKPKQPAVASSSEKGKAADFKVESDDSKNPTTPEMTKRAGAYSCDIHIDNRTNLVVHRIYVDGRNRGGISRYGDGLVRDVEIGPTRLYAEADFSDGSTSRWGPRVFNCNSWATHTWTLNR